ncbi:MAG: CHAD domain-containing protein [Alphaproteobacteria bacterium]
MPNPEPKQEFELKLTAAPDVLRQAFAATPAGGVGDPPTAADRLTAVYYDTPDHRLARHGAALRVRREGKRFTQTLKVAAGPLARLEHDVEVAGLAPDLDRLPRDAMAKRVGAVLADELAPVFASEVTRRTRRVTVANGVAGEVELALDEGEIRAGERREPIAELEVELKAGAPAALFQVADTLVAAGATRLVAGSKAARGYALASDRGPAWAKAQPTSLARDDAVGDALGHILDGVFHQIWANLDAAYDGRDPEGVHQLRVAVRRLRSALTLFKPVLAAERRAALNDEARWAMGQLGPVRDRDVFATEMLPPVAQARPNDAALAALRATAEDARERAYGELRGAMASARWTRLVLTLARWIHARGWYDEADAATQLALAEPLGAFADRVLAKRAKAVKKSGKNFAELDAEHRHEVRKDLKKLRYAAEFLRGLYPEKPTKRYLKRLSALQDAFGHLNDTATAERLLGALIDPSEPRLAEARGLVLGWYGHAAAGAAAELVADWEDFVAAEPFWRGHGAC